MVAEARPTNAPGRARWRREWDSNPRYALTYTRFPSVRLKPLGHLSVQNRGVPLVNISTRWRRRLGQPTLPAVPGGGEGGIRTPDTREGITVFETAAFNHSANSSYPATAFSTLERTPAEDASTPRRQPR